MERARGAPAAATVRPMSGCGALASTGGAFAVESTMGVSEDAGARVARYAAFGTIACS